MTCGRRVGFPVRCEWQRLPAPPRITGKVRNYRPLKNFRGLRKIINHHRMRRFRGFYGVNYAGGTTGAANKPRAFAPWPGVSTPTDLNRQNRRPPPKAWNSKTRVKRILLQILVKSQRFLPHSQQAYRVRVHRNRVRKREDILLQREIELINVIENQ